MQSDISSERETDMRSFDYSFLANRRWDIETMNLISLIHEYKGKQDLYLRQKPAELDKLVEFVEENLK